MLMTPSNRLETRAHQGGSVARGYLSPPLVTPGRSDGYKVPPLKAVSPTSSHSHGARRALLEETSPSAPRGLRAQGPYSFPLAPSLPRGRRTGRTSAPRAAAGAGGHGQGAAG